MSIDSLLNRIKETWLVSYTGSSVDEINRLESNLKAKLPDEYKKLLMWSNGGEGYIGRQYISLWPISTIVSLNMDYSISTYFPKVIGIGTDGGDECYGFDFSSEHLIPPFIQVSLNDLSDDSVTNLGSSMQDWINKSIDQYDVLFLANNKIRYNYFINKVAEQRWMWGLYRKGEKAHQNYWATTDISDENDTLLIWSDAEYAANYAQGKWSNYSPMVIDWRYFSDKILPTLKKEKKKISVFATPRMEGVIVIPENLFIEVDSLLQHLNNRDGNKKKN